MEFQATEEIGWRPDWGPFAAMMATLWATRPFAPQEVSVSAMMPGTGGAPKPLTSDERAAAVRAGGGVVRTPPKLIVAKPKGQPGG